MRVITGEAKGRKLYALPGRHTRPTADFVKQAVFNMIRDGVAGRRVLDLFAGTGQMGIEALSRGAVQADFVDEWPEAAIVIQKNLKHCGLDGRSRVYTCGAAEFLGGARERYGLIFLDPPYASPLLDNAVQEILRFDLLLNDGIIVCESGAACPPPDAGGARRVCRQFGRKAITLLYREDVK